MATNAIASAFALLILHCREKLSIVLSDYDYYNLFVTTIYYFNIFNRMEMKGQYLFSRPSYDIMISS